MLQPPGIDNPEASYALIREKNQRYWPRFSASEYDRRYSAIRRAMAAREIDCLLMFSNGYVFSANLIYVANYIDIAYGAIVFPLNRDPALFTSLYSFVPQAVAQAVIDDVRWGAGINHQALVDHIKSLRLHHKKIGIADRLPHDLWIFLQNSLPDATLVEAQDLMQQVRLCASPEEINWYRKGAELCDQAFTSLVQVVEPGMKDYELVGTLHGAYLKLGGSLFGAALASTPMADPSTPYSWWVAGGSTRTIEPGDLILTETTGTYYGYPGQLIRPIALGEPPAQLRKLETLATSLYTEVQRVVKVGNTPRDVLTLSQRILEEGFTIQCPVIHGYTQVIHGPYASVPGDACWAVDLDVPFRENQLLVIEPNPTTRDMQTGFFIGDMNRVTPQGAVSLHEYPLQLSVRPG